MVSLIIFNFKKFNLSKNISKHMFQLMDMIVLNVPSIKKGF